MFAIHEICCNSQLSCQYMYVTDDYYVLWRPQHYSSELLQTQIGHLFSGVGNSLKFSRSQLFYLENENNKVCLIEMLYTIGSTLRHSMEWN
jgi:hypothetical protein